MHNKDHWENVYKTKPSNTVSWFQQQAKLSYDFILDTGVAKDEPIIDIGGGTSALVDELTLQGYSDISVLDISGSALEVSKDRLGSAADKVDWIEADITAIKLPEGKYAIWHDRAVFHFLIDEQDKLKYEWLMNQSLKTNGHLIIATFAEDGPTKCSNLPVSRYSVDELAARFSGFLNLVSFKKEEHHTPFDTIQTFNYCHFIKRE